MLKNHAEFRICQLAFVGLLSGFAMSPVLAESGDADKDCQCRAPGGLMRDLGTVQCVDIAGKNILMYCTMSTNTPYWKEVENVEGCPAA